MDEGERPSMFNRDDQERLKFDQKLKIMAKGNLSEEEFRKGRECDRAEERN